MNAKFIGGTLLLALFVYQAQATEPAKSGFVIVPEAVTVEQDVGGKDQPKQLDKEKKAPDTKVPEKNPTQPPQTDIFDPSLMPRSETSNSFNPHMMGDFPGVFGRRNVTLSGFQTTTTSVTRNVGIPPKPTTVIGLPVTTAASATFSLLAPVTGLGAFKVAENASPMPQDRVFSTYNYFDDIRAPQSGAIAPMNTTQITTTTGAPVRGVTTVTTSTTNTFIPGLPSVSANLNREVFGFEKTFLNGNASVELRVPLLQQNSSVDGFASKDIGDLTIIGKYALLLDRDTGNVFSLGLAVTAPTGPSIPTIDGNLHPTLLQPWFGYIWNADKFYVQAFHSLVVPTDSRDVTLLFNDVGINYWLYRGDPNRVLNFIVPMAEVHVTTPLNHRDVNSLIVVPDIVVFTGGVHLGLFRNGTLSVGVAAPVTGPRPFNVEAFVQLNWRF